MTERSEASYGGLRFVVEHDSSAGWYLYVYEGDFCTHDYLQDTREAAVEQATELFGVPQSAWRNATG
jgi:hypothetical protein